MGRQHQRRGTVGENEEWQKEIVLYWEELFRKITELLQQRWQQNKYSSGRPCFHKYARHELHKSNTHDRNAIAKPLITESNAQMRKRRCHGHKTLTSDNWKRARDMVRWVILHAVPYIRKSLRLENRQRSLQSGMPGSDSETLGRFGDGLGSNIMVQYSVGPIITLHGWITARQYVDWLGNQVHPMIQTLFPNNDAVFQDDNAVQSLFEEHEGEPEHLSWPAQSSYLNITEPLKSVLETSVRNRLRGQCFPSCRFWQISLLTASLRVYNSLTSLSFILLITLLSFHVKL
jgi:hypothetical protein